MSRSAETIRMPLFARASFPIAAVRHVPPFAPSQLSEVLGSRSRSLIGFASSPVRFELEDSGRVSYARPAADRLFVVVRDPEARS